MLSGQRTADRSLFLGLTQMVSVSSRPSGGAALECGQYLLNAYWKAGVSATDYNQRYNTTGGELENAFFDHLHLDLYGGWMQRLVSTYSRSLSLYAGGCAFVGYHHFGVFHPLPPEHTAGYPRGEFIYGLTPELELEWFPAPRFALTLGVRSPITFGSSLGTADMWHVCPSLGLRFNL